MGHAGVYRLARFNIDTRCIVFKAIDGLAQLASQKWKVWLGVSLDTASRLSLFQHDKVGGMGRLNRRILRDNFKNVGSRFVERFFHRVLQGERRGRATTAGTVQLKPNDAIAHADQLAISAMRLKVRPDRLETADNPGFNIVGMEGMQQEHAGDEVVFEGRSEHPLTLRRLHAPVDQALQRGAMQLNHRLNQLQRSGPNLRVARLVELGRQLLYMFTLGAELSAPRCGVLVAPRWPPLFGPRRPEHG